MGRLHADVNGFTAEIVTEQTLPPQAVLVQNIFEQLGVFKKVLDLDTIEVTNPTGNEYRVEISVIDGRKFNQTVELLQKGHRLSWDVPDEFLAAEIKPYDSLRTLFIRLARKHELELIEAVWS